MQPIEILVVEDNPGDVLLLRKAFERSRIANTLHVVGDGEAALQFLRREPPYEGALRPMLVLLDINLPRVNGLDVLELIKGDPELARIPVVMLTSSDSERDINQSYARHANSYVTKPPTAQGLHAAVEKIADYWFVLVKHPT